STCMSNHHRRKNGLAKRLTKSEILHKARSVQLQYIALVNSTRCFLRYLETGRPCRIQIFADRPIRFRRTGMNGGEGIKAVRAAILTPTLTPTRRCAPLPTSFCSLSAPAPTHWQQ